ncbi:MAG: NAD(P)H-dependent oxidoreductase [Candidatus Magasanikbacteria bacterium]|nr:NAD(P)H-dependent oxidoreductase [Candidatus Magasanikbacteria bacterium]
MALPRLTLILGTARAGRRSEAVAKYLQEILQERSDLSVEFADVRDYLYGHTIPPWEENPVTARWRELVARTDAFLIVAPEYNHGYPGELKILLDAAADSGGYHGKPVAFCGVSQGLISGARGVEQLAGVARDLGLVTMRASLYVANVNSFAEKSRAERDEKYRESLDRLIAALFEHLPAFRKGSAL